MTPLPSGGRPITLAVIPARGGSKGLPGKNTRPLAGLPLIGWSIRSAKESRTLTRTIVSTEDPSIAETARAAGGDVPFMRPAELAQDDSSLVGVLRHAVAWFESNEGTRVEVVVLLQPTSPFRAAEDIDSVVRLILEGGADSAETVVEDHAHPYHRYFLKDGRLLPWRPEMSASSRRQDFPPVYKPTGSVYTVRRDLLMEEGVLSGKDHRGLLVGPERSIDIDDEWDFRLAQWLADVSPRTTEAPR